uniref:Uncharacterized protein n=1 Tax=Pristhesancus plagipennis TaxID=1955184 RepID=A0A2K8JMQ2_PRIPG|nr:secreted hypothetical protein [Pristhesancus plagipennis]
MNFYIIFALFAVLIASVLAKPAPEEITEDLFALRPIGARRELITMDAVCAEGECS